MTQITHGIRSVLSHPIVYNSFQNLMGARQMRTFLTNNFIHPEQGMNVLDIGCGPAEILDYLPAVNYWGFDISEPYIQQATSRYGTKGKFTCQTLGLNDLQDLPRFDIVLALGLLHHLDDTFATQLLNIAYSALKSGGRLITLDPCLEIGQNPIARYLILKDRGQNVRSRDGYNTLISNVFSQYHIEVRHKSGIPYTHCFTECTRTE